MNRALLDTHVLLWWLAEPERLSKQQFDIISSRESQILVSVASIWEIRIKESLAKLEVPADLVTLIKEEGIEFLSVNVFHADGVRNLSLHHKDPFDRIIISQSILEGLTVLSSDNIFKQYDINVVD